MIFDSFLVVDNNNQEHVIKVHFHKQKVSYCKHPRKVFVNNEIDLFKYSDEDNFFVVVRNKNNKSNTNNNYFKNELGLTQAQILGTKRIAKYHCKRKLKNVETSGRFMITVGKTTIKRLRKALVPYGKFSLKLVENHGFRDEFLVLKTYDKNVLQHLYFYNTVTKNKIKVDDFASLAGMCGDKKKYKLEKKPILETGSKLVDYKSNLSNLFENATDDDLEKLGYCNINIDKLDETNTVLRFDRYAEVDNWL
jgi:hypothetical protein